MSNADLAALNSRFGIPGQLSFREQPEGFVLAEVENPSATATLALQGAQLLSWSPGDRQSVLWLSPEARFAAGKSVRGGVPVCWPWFGPHATDGAMPAHGFARTASWKPVGVAVLDGGTLTRLEFTLPQGAATRGMWPHGCELSLRVDIGADLVMELRTRNTGSTEFVLGQALHSYFSVSDIRQVAVNGLDACDYLDKVGPAQRRRQIGALTFSGETDRIYLNTRGDCFIDDPGLGRRICISKRGSASTVVWNPWIDKSARLGDMGEDGYLHMLCVESANAADDVVHVRPGSEHCLRVAYSVSSL